MEVLRGGRLFRGLSLRLRGMSLRLGGKGKGGERMVGGREERGRVGEGVRGRLGRGKGRPCCGWWWLVLMEATYETPPFFLGV